MFSLLAWPLVLVPLFLANFCEKAVHAQTPLVTLTGEIFDPSGGLVPAADVLATNIETGVETHTETNGDGIYLLGALQAGRYRIGVTKQGFRQTELNDVTLQTAASVTRNFHLELGSSSDRVNVEDNGLDISMTDASVSTVISREFVDQIPLNGRTLQNLLPLSPGVVPDGVSSSNVGYSGYSVNGNRDTGSVNWIVDGVSGNIGATPNGSTPDSLAAGLTILGTTQSLVSLDALQEFRLSTSSYGVEYGVAPGAQIQLQSRAGSNHFHGSAYDYVRNTIFDANDWFANSEALGRPTERQNDFGGTLGGPVWIPHVYNGRDKAFFFFSFEDLHLRQPAVLSGQPTPTAAYRESAPAALQPYLNAFPAPNAPSLGNGWGTWNASFSSPSVLHSVSIRGDYAVTNTTRVFVRINDAPSNVTSLSDAYQTTFLTNNLTETLGITTALTASISNDFRFNFSRSNYGVSSNLLPSSYGGISGPAFTALTPPPQYVIPGSGYYSNIVITDPSLPGYAVLLLQNQSSRLHQWNIVDGLKWQVGRHQLKLGGEWNRHTSIQEPISYEQTFQFFSLASLESSTVDELDVQSQPFVTSTINTRSALYAGDTWKTNQRLSIDYGLRWELPVPTYFQGPFVPLFVSSIADPNNPTIAQGRTQWPMTWRNFAPRVGVAYLLRDAGNFGTVLRVGGGLFYSTELGAGVGAVTYPDDAFTSTYSLPFPVPPSQLVPPQTGVITPDGLAQNSLVGIAHNLAVPRVWEWNFSLEQQLGTSQSFTASYVGSAGRRLFFYPAIFPPSDVIGAVTFTENASQSNYNSLQLKFNRGLARGFQTLASYSWSHSIDNVSQDDYNYQPLWGNSDFDVRHAVSLAFLYDIPGLKTGRALKAVTSGWELSTNFQARTGLPVTGLFAPADVLPGGALAYVPAELVPGVPVYLNGPQYPGGTKLNRAAFAKPAAGQQGDVGRNEFRNQGFWQLDNSLHRKFSLGENRGLLRLRLDAFDLLNHPNFAGYFVRNLTTSPLFGQATSMVNNFGGASPIYNSGGPRSVQVSLRYEF